MLCDGRVELEIAHGLLWTTMRSYRDGQTIPFRRTRMPWPTLRPRTERRAVGFGASLGLDARVGRDLHARAHRRRRRDALEVAALRRRGPRPLQLVEHRAE